MSIRHFTGLFTCRARAVAAQDKLWRAMQYHVDVPFIVEGLEPDVFEAWTWGKLKLESRKVDLMHPNRLTQLRNIVRQQPLISKEGLVDRGIRIRNEEPRKLSQTGEVPHVDQVRKMAQEIKEEFEVRKKATLSCSVKPSGSTIGSAYEPSSKEAPHHPSNPHLMERCLLSGVRLGPSLSTKLNYILSEVFTPGANWESRLTDWLRFYFTHPRRSFSYSPSHRSRLHM